MPNALRLRLPEVVVLNKRLGRHIGHDPASLRFLVEEAAPAVTSWERITPILNQGDLGSCTGNAAVGVLGSTVCFEALDQAQRTALGEDLAVRVYTLATTLDGFPGQMPQQDTGSDGNSAAKATRNLGYSSGWKHATSLGGMHRLIQAGPFMVGTNWLSDMDQPNAEGVVRATGVVRGGHEYEVLNYTSAGLWECVNSWSDSWGKGGHFFLPDEDMAVLLADQGDATALVPLSAPAPTPIPPPGPEVNAFPAAQWEAFRADFTKLLGSGQELVQAMDTWLLRTP
jgi:hypothetical protein